MTTFQKTILWSAIFLAQLPVLAIYVIQLSRNPIYGWIPLLCLLAAGLLFAVRWNRQPELPASRLALLGIMLGLVAASLAALSSRPWLGIVGFIFTAGSFFMRQRNRAGESLFPIWFVLWPLIILPFGGNETLTQWLHLELFQAVEGLLRLGEVLHIAYSNSIAVNDVRLYFDQLVYSSTSWPAFVASAMLYSAIMQRKWFVAVLNYVSSVYWCFAYQCCVALISLLYGISVDTGMFLLLSIAVALAAFLLFVSTERGIRGLLSPITEGLSDARLINPFVVAWNWCFANRKRHSRKSSSTSFWNLKTTLLATSIVVGMVIIAQLSQIPNVLRALQSPGQVRIDESKIQNTAFEKTSIVDYRHSYRSIPMVDGVEADIWTEITPILTAEHVVLSQLSHAFDATDIFVGNGWQLVESASEELKLADEQVLSVRFSSLSKADSDTQLYSVWLTQAGKPIASDSSGEIGRLVMSAALAPKSCGALSKSSLKSTFERLLADVQSQLASSATDP